MKKIICSFLFLLLCLTGCSNTEKVPEIDEYTWKMTSIQGNEDGSVVACAPELAANYDVAKEIVLTCEAQNGNLIIKDLTNNHSYTGTYCITTTSPESVIYELAIGTSKGFATTGMTSYLDKSQKPTFIISMADYAINFDCVILEE